MAGKKLLELPTEIISGEILAIADHTNRWYEVLRYNSDEFEYRFTAQQIDEYGNSLGSISIGTVNLPAEASARLCILYGNVPTNYFLTESKIARVERWLHKEATERGRLWLVGGFILMLIITALSI